MSSSWLWLVQGGVIAGLNVQIQDHPGITAWVPVIGGGVDCDPFPRLGRRVFQWLQGVVFHSSWLILSWFICPSCLVHFTQFLKSWLEAFVEYFYLSFTLEVMGAEKVQSMPSC